MQLSIGGTIYTTKRRSPVTVQKRLRRNHLRWHVQFVDRETNETLCFPLRRVSWTRGGTMRIQIE